MASEKLLNIGTQCRLCGEWFADGDVQEYDVVLEDGEYPATFLCNDCAEETALDCISITAAPRPSEEGDHTQAEHA